MEKRRATRNREDANVLRHGSTRKEARRRMRRRMKRRRPCGFYHSSLQREYIPYFRSARREADRTERGERKRERERERPERNKESIRCKELEERRCGKENGVPLFKETIFFIYEMAREITLIDRER